MKITYHKNPLCTKVEMDEHEQKELWYKIKINEMDNLLFDTHFHLSEKYFDLEKVKKNVDPDYYMSEDDDQQSKLDLRCDMLLKHYTDELQWQHCGDCTCVACSCEKCHAESLLGINTTEGLSKYAAHKIDAAFGKNNEKTIDEVLDSLANYHPVKGDNWNGYSQEDFDRHLPRWKAEAQQAYDWLLNYKNTHFKDEI